MWSGRRRRAIVRIHLLKQTVAAPLQRRCGDGGPASAHHCCATVEAHHQNRFIFEHWTSSHRFCIRPCPKASAVLPRGSVQIWGAIHTSTVWTRIPASTQMGTLGLTSAASSSNSAGNRDIGVQVGGEPFSKHLNLGSTASVSYTHLTLPTNREV